MIIAEEKYKDGYIVYIDEEEIAKKMIYLNYDTATLLDHLVRTFEGDISYV